ncbi:unnamed protein product [Symbiodinium natans]|uniref:Uncharacterized protein n=1 Tax=Symbiodinium natans TaxID=878477 RepID=A0A812VFC1_9DINO|nr:unnamed protein product [Symbiodinium natans]
MADAPAASTAASSNAPEARSPPETKAPSADPKAKVKRRNPGKHEREHNKRRKLAAEAKETLQSGKDKSTKPKLCELHLSLLAEVAELNKLLEDYKNSFFWYKCNRPNQYWVEGCGLLNSKYLNLPQISNELRYPAADASMKDVIRSVQALTSVCAEVYQVLMWWDRCVPGNPFKFWGPPRRDTPAAPAAPAARGHGQTVSSSSSGRN